MNHKQSTSLMATTRTEITHGLTYSVARAIVVTAWQSVDAVRHCCLTHRSHGSTHWNNLFQIKR